MELSVTLRMALRALGRNKMRTILTMLGVIIGVASVICTVAIGEGRRTASRPSSWRWAPTWCGSRRAG